MNEEELNELEDILEVQFNRNWTKTVISECYLKGMDEKQTLDYLHGLAEFTNEIFDQLAKMDGYNKEEVIEK